MSQRPADTAVQVTARARFIRMSAYKMREVAALIKDKPIDEARRILAFTPKSASRELAKVLESAIANAEHNYQIPQEDLIVKVASADEGSTIKRFRARAQGRGYRIRKRTCHVNLVLIRDPKKIEELPPTAAPRRARRGGSDATEASKRGVIGGDAPTTRRTTRSRKAAAPATDATEGAGSPEKTSDEGARDEGEA